MPGLATQFLVDPLTGALNIEVALPGDLKGTRLPVIKGL